MLAGLSWEVVGRDRVQRPKRRCRRCDVSSSEASRFLDALLQATFIGFRRAIGAGSGTTGASLGGLSGMTGCRTVGGEGLGSRASSGCCNP